MALGKAKSAEDESPVDWARRRIVAAGYWCHKIQHIFPPLDSHDETEVWFLGRESVRANAPAERLTAYISNDPNGNAVVAVGW